MHVFTSAFDTHHAVVTNKYLPENSRLCISLYNSIKALVIIDTSHALCGLVTTLRKVRVPSGLGQNKYVTDAFDVRLNGDIKGGELWKAVELWIPAYHTTDGECLWIACAMSIPTLFPSRIQSREFRFFDCMVHCRTGCTLLFLVPVEPVGLVQLSPAF